jgi:hypothetical protein
LEDWKNINEIDDLSDLVIKRPPPIKKEPTVEPTPKNPKYDETYIKPLDATYTGILLGVSTFVINYWIGNTEFSSEENYNSTMLSLRIASLIIRIIVVFYVIEIAKRQNRNTTGWGWFAFFLPSFALIIIGLQKKLFKEGVQSEVSKTSSKKDFVREVTLSDGQILKFKTDLGYYGGSIVFIDNKPPANGYYREKLSDRVYLIKDGVTFIEYYIEGYMFEDIGLLEIFCDFTSGRKKGSPVFNNGKPASDGIYKISWLTKITVKGGVIV